MVIQRDNKSFKTQLSSSVQYIHMQTCNMNFTRDYTYTCTKALYSIYVHVYTCTSVIFIPASEAGHRVSGGDVFFNVVF